MLSQLFSHYVGSNQLYPVLISRPVAYSSYTHTHTHTHILYSTELSSDSLMSPCSLVGQRSERSWESERVSDLIPHSTDGLSAAQSSVHPDGLAPLFPQLSLSLDQLSLSSFSLLSRLSDHRVCEMKRPFLYPSLSLL